MRIETTARPTGTPQGSIDGAGPKSETTSPPSPPSPAGDGFDKPKPASWGQFFSPARKALSPEVKQARAEPSPPAAASVGGPLPDALYHCAEKLPKDEKHAPLRALYAEAKQLAEAGEPGKAAEKLERALSRYEEEIDASKALGDGGVAGTRNLAAQYRVLEDMQARGVEASHPPTQDEMRRYMKSFDAKQDRPAALAAFEAYTSAFYVHPANVGRPDEDIKYSEDPTKHAYRGKLYEKSEDAEKAQAKKPGQLIYDITTHDASEWKDVTADRERKGLGGPHPHAAGKHVIDCEGYAYLAQELLGAAGYKHEQVAVTAKSGEQHAMTVLTDPSRKGHYAVVSNDGVYTAAKKKDALDAGFRAAMPEGAVPGGYFYGRTQHHAQVQMMRAQP